MDHFEKDTLDMNHQQKIDYVVAITKSAPEQASHLAVSLLACPQNQYYYGYFGLIMAQQLKRQDLLVQGLSSPSAYVRLQATKAAPFLMTLSDILPHLLDSAHSQELKERLLSEFVLYLHKQNKKESTSEVESIFLSLHQNTHLQQNEPAFAGRLLPLCSSDTLVQHFQHYAPLKINDTQFWRLCHLRHLTHVQQYCQSVVNQVLSSQSEFNNLKFKYSFLIQFMMEHFHGLYLDLQEGLEIWNGATKSLPNHLLRKYVKEFPERMVVLWRKKFPAKAIRCLSKELQDQVFSHYDQDRPSFLIKYLASLKDSTRCQEVYDKFIKHKILTVCPSQVHLILEYVRYEQKALEMARYYDSKKDDTKFMAQNKEEMAQYYDAPIAQYIEDSKQQKDVEKRIGAYQGMIKYASRVYSPETLLKVCSYLKTVLANQQDTTVHRVFCTLEMSITARQLGTLPILDNLAQLITNALKKRDLSTTTIQYALNIIISIFKYFCNHPDRPDAQQIIKWSVAHLDLFFNKECLVDRVYFNFQFTTTSQIQAIKPVLDTYIHQKLQNWGHCKVISLLNQITCSQATKPMLNSFFGQYLQDIVMAQNIPSKIMMQIQTTQQQAISRWLDISKDYSQKMERIQLCLQADPTNILNSSVFIVMMYTQQRWVDYLLQALDKDRQLVLHGFPYQDRFRNRTMPNRVRPLIKKGMTYMAWSPQQQVSLREFLFKCQDKSFMGKSDINQDFLEQMYITHISALPSCRFQDLESIQQSHQENVRLLEQVIISIGDLDTADSEQNLKFWLQFINGECSKVAIDRVRKQFSQLTPLQVDNIFQQLLSSKKLSVVKQALMLYEEYPCDSAWQRIMHMAHQDIHKDLRIQITLLMIRLLYSPKQKYELDIWNWLNKIAPKYDFLFGPIVETNPLKLYGQDTPQKMFQIVVQCLNSSDDEIRQTVFDHAHKWLSYDYHLFANIVKQRITDLTMQGRDLNSAINLINPILNSDQQFMQSFLMDMLSKLNDQSQLQYKIDGILLTKTIISQLNGISHKEQAKVISEGVQQLVKFMLNINRIYITSMIDLLQNNIKLNMDIDYPRQISNLRFLIDLIAHQYPEQINNVFLRYQYERMVDLKKKIDSLLAMLQENNSDVQTFIILRAMYSDRIQLRKIEEFNQIIERLFVESKNSLIQMICLDYLEVSKTE